MIQNIRYGIVDDNPIDALLLKEYLSAHPHFLHLFTYHNPQTALAEIVAKPPDVIFLDVEMPGITGIEVLKKVNTLIPICVMTTSHPDYAVEGFENAALDYVLKPITENRLIQTVARIEDFWQMRQKSIAYDLEIQKDTLLIKEGHDQLKIRIAEIIYLEAMQDYTKIVTTTRNYLTLSTLKKLEENLSVYDFLRIHRSYLIAKKRITKKTKESLFCDQTELPIGKTYRSEIAKMSL